LQFRQKGLVFTRQQGEVVHIVSLQSSVGSTASLLKITVNLGVFVPSLAGDGTRPDLLGSHWQMRLGFLMPEHMDYWWEVSGDGDVKRAASQMVEAVQKYALPQFGQLETRAALVTLWRAGRSPGLTAFQAKRYLDKLEHEPAG
jgi:hypothetical protein